MHKDLVSVYVVTCNRLELLKRCIKSIQDQDYSNIEIIIVDDHSTDETPKYLTELADNDSRVKFFINDTNRGACYSRNIAIDNAIGEYITGCDDDDYFLPNRISTFVDKAYLLERYEFIYSNNFFYVNGKIKKSLANQISPKKINANDLLIYNSAGNQIFTKTRSLHNIKFNESLPAWQDFECWLRMLSKGNRYALNLNAETYVQDVSHGAARISISKVKKIMEARDIIIMEHKLNESQQKIIDNHLRTYEEYKKLRITSMLEMIKVKFSFFTVFLTFLYLFKTIKSKVIQ